jgi:hypothetical protein
VEVLVEVGFGVVVVVVELNLATNYVSVKVFACFLKTHSYSKKSQRNFSLAEANKISYSFR